MLGEFYTTRNLFRDFTNYQGPLSYEEWLALPEEHKAAVLYLQYFEQITLAWTKLKSVYSLESDGVSEVLQYLNKNVVKISEDAKRFTPAYIYKVSYNCLYCLCRDANRHKRAYENEMSNIVSYGEDELDLFDTIGVEDDPLTKDETMLNQEAFWSLIEDTDKDTISVISKLLGYNDGRKVEEDRMNEIIDGLRIKLAGFVNVSF